MRTANRFSLENYTFDWKAIVALFFGGFLGALIVAALNVFSMMVFGKNFEYEKWYFLVMNAFMWCGAIAGFDFFVVRPTTGRKLSFNMSTKNFSTYLFIFPLMLGMMLIAEFVTGLVPISGPFFGPLYEFFTQLMEQLSQSNLVLVISAVIMAPIFEEIVFRGIIQKGLINRGTKPINAIWISAIVFGLVHANPWQFVGAVLLGYVMGLVYYKTKSLLMPILLHAFNNGISALLLIFGDTESIGEFFGISSYVILAIGIIIFAISFYFFTKKYEILHQE